MDAVRPGAETATMGHRCGGNDIHGPPLRLPGPAEQHPWAIVAAAARTGGELPGLPSRGRTARTRTTVTITKCGSCANFVIVVTQGGGVRVCAGGRHAALKPGSSQTARRHRPANWQHAPRTRPPRSRAATDHKIRARARNVSQSHPCGEHAAATPASIPPAPEITSSHTGHTNPGPGLAPAPTKQARAIKIIAPLQR